MRHRLQQLAPLIATLVFIGAAALLWHQLRGYNWADIRGSLQSIPTWKIALCIGLTTANYIVLIGYDWLALSSIHHPLPFRQVAFASFTGFVATYNFGATLGGLPVRYRVYSSLGLSSIEVMQVAFMLGLTFGIGEIATAGLSFVIDPIVIPEQLNLPFHAVKGLGWTLIAITAGYLLLTAFIHKPLRIRGHDVRLPKFGVTLAQIGVSVADLVLAAGCLYSLMPADFSMNFPQLLGAYLLAIIAVMLTHVPGGVGVFELVILTLTGSTNKEDVVAALLIFRVIYYLLPLLVATLLIAVMSLVRQLSKVQPIVRGSGRIVTSIAPTILAMATFLAGIVLLISGAIPSVSSNMKLLENFVGLHVVEVSHFVGSLAGGALILVARGLQRRLDTAWWGAVCLLTIGIFTSLLKGIDYQEAIVLLLVLLSLVSCRNRFNRPGRLLHERFSFGWFSTITISVLSCLWLGVFIYKNGNIQSDRWWEFAIHGDAPRFLRSCVGVAALLVLWTIGRICSPSKVGKSGLPTESDLQTASEIIAKSTRTSANLALLGDKRFLFSDAQDAFLMYAVENRSWISMGNPVGPPERWPELIWRFRELCDSHNGRPVFYQVGADSLPLYVDHGLTFLKLGEEGRVSAREFSLSGHHFQNMRSTRNRILKAECQFEVIPKERVADYLPRLKEVSDAWLAEKHAAEKGFSLGFFDAEYLQRFPCAVVKQNEKVLAFANLWLGANNEEFSVDLMRHDPSGPSGLMDFLFLELIFWGQQQGYEWFSMGMAPLSGIEDRPYAPMWNKAVGVLYRNGDHYYNFQGLRSYKDKFRPVWEPRYLATPGGIALPQVLSDLVRLIGREKKPGESPQTTKMLDE
ncbi:Phosphatidylglycerol lysyltransferase [Thalassoglobus neptunius]|uniref:Phosphatidylglycerol lysyltransferase n=1 Tax=Thalassoglobus neptunius TaxID=1938619 RepID=A0A5C5WNC9_9PLAN|nr:bifunctional lysylphosphatidylglycerol flippase/synthetase MprF [Thalassoglobus neptunius]TWT51695.1 Phosphatidylglycerol lysyltransferase [Thalassoglobus neptunius]